VYSQSCEKRKQWHRVSEQWRFNVRGAIEVSFDSLDQHARFDLVQLGQVAIEHHLMAAGQEESAARWIQVPAAGLL